MTQRYTISFIPGDGIGTEVLPVGRDAIGIVADRHGFEVRWKDFDWSCTRFEDTGSMMPEDGIGPVPCHTSWFGK